MNSPTDNSRRVALVSSKIAISVSLLVIIVAGYEAYTRGKALPLLASGLLALCVSLICLQQARKNQRP